jgi:glycerate dehydrogenase
MNIVFLDRSTLGEDICIDMFSQLGNVTSYDITQADETLNRVKEADIVVTNKVVISKEIMDASKIKLICVAATGMNNIDLEHAKAKNIPVKNVAGYSTNSVAQVTLSMVLHFLTHLNFYNDFTKAGKWQISPIFTNLDQPFHELQDKKWGIIGLGTIGKKVAQIASAFDCNVVYYSTSGVKREEPYESVELDELLQTCDIISVHAPLNEQTKNLLNETNMQQLKDKAIVINVGRGGIINEQAIQTMIDSKEVYFGIDVASKEPIEKNSPLLKIQNKEQLVMTPHIAWASIEARKRLVALIYQNIKTFLKA